MASSVAVVGMQRGDHVNLGGQLGTSIDSATDRLRNEHAAKTQARRQ